MPTTSHDFRIGTTTVTSYTTTTPDPNAWQTVTSNGLVIVVLASTTQGQAPSVVYVTQGNDAANEYSGPFSSWAIMLVGLLGVGSLMIFL